MQNQHASSVFLNSASSPLFLTKGLYSGLKSRNGLATPLPIALEEGDDYVNTGYLDSLPTSFIRQLDIDCVDLHVQHEGSVDVSIYLLLQSGAILHCFDQELVSDDDECVHIPSVAILDPNTRSIYFRIRAQKGSANLRFWYFSTSSSLFYQSVRRSNASGFPLVSRSLGESGSLIQRFISLYAEYQRLRELLPHLVFASLPNITIYESDTAAFQKSKKILKSAGYHQIRIVFNPYNLGGGGNMSLAISRELPRIAKQLCFGMVDSDTILPLRTIYFSSLLLSSSRSPISFGAVASTIFYATSPNQVLESGALFGRGNWGIVSNHPTQPCIQPLHHRRLIAKPETQAVLASGGHSDYPPFIYSLFRAESKDQLRSFLPIPFFLRGDDIELGMSLRSAGATCQVDGALVAFQEPKHSLWHELMAILHGCVLVMADASERGDASFFPELNEFFLSRANAHQSICDIEGLLCYQRVLQRLLALTEWPFDEIVNTFHDPSYYLAQRDLNASFSSSNYKMINALDRQVSTNQQRFLRLPFLYFEASLPDIFMSPEHPLPHRIALVNPTQQTASIISPSNIPQVTLTELYNSIASLSEYLFQSSGEALASRCAALCDRAIIQRDYLGLYKDVTIVSPRLR